MIDILRIDTDEADSEERIENLINWEAREDAAVETAVKTIVERVRSDGDRALIVLTAEYDDFSVTSMERLMISSGRCREAYESLIDSDKKALDDAAVRIRLFHEEQTDESFEMQDKLGNILGYRVTALQHVGVYVPGGQAAYPSTVLMTVIPARIAGVREVTAVVPTPKGERNQHVLASMHLAGVDHVYAIGGAQAIAALAYGTETIKSVDKIVGPGGSFVTAAKRLVYGPVGIDAIAGPTEILIVADGSVPARWTALDLCAQAEHDPTAQAILISPYKSHVEAVRRELEEIVPGLERREIIERSFANRGAFIKCGDLEQAVAIVNRFAPEHLQLSVHEPEVLLPLVQHAGAIFVGGYSAEVFGDYVAGPSHVLPTYGSARYASGLSVREFQKRSSIIQCSREGAHEIARIASTLADAEGLTAHSAAALARSENI
ncbi:MAG: histidinol dehydrogenase [Pseudomonadota bacterium]|nr:histidinol dehydrogenase [Pseudomonadota bacterium]